MATAAPQAPPAAPLVLETMEAYRSVLQARRAAGARVGLVPTMGALHEGHLALMGRARAECDQVAVTIFVNPLQFNDPTDAAAYPKDLDGDLAACRREGVSVVLAPGVTEVYPEGPGSLATTVKVTGVSEAHEGASRPGHFDGVATVVTKLFSVTGPCRAYFGEKDFQQLAVVRRLVADLSLPVEVVGCPTVREADGLALSSRNRRLDGDGRRAATVVPRALRAGAEVARAGGPPRQVEEEVAAVVDGEPRAALDYATVVDPATLVALAHEGPVEAARLLVAVVVDGVRLIDNTAVGVDIEKEAWACGVA